MRSPSSLLVATVVVLALGLSSTALADARSQAHDAHPDEAVALDGLVAEITLVKMALRGCEGRTCVDVRARAAVLGNHLQGLWAFIEQPDGQRDALELAWSDVEKEVLWLDAYVPQAGVEDADALMREWVGTRERIDRFKRTMRLLTGEPSATAQR